MNSDAIRGNDDDTEVQDAVPELPILAEPADGTPEVVATRAALDQAIEALSAGTGPVGVDTERAHGFRYSARAYLIQLRRAGTGTVLIDPVAFRNPPAEADLSALGEAIGDAEWIVHAATQDLPCLVEIGLVPRRLFDTELAARLLGDPRVALGTLVENAFGLRLLKEHSAANWSTRPLPAEWLTYAALDVELLAELRDRLHQRLDEAGKLPWAEQEFAHLVAHASTAKPPRTDPWRRTGGLHQVRTPRGVAVVRELWTARDKIARDTDTAPGRIVPDKAISQLATMGGRQTPEASQLRQVEGFRRRQARRYEPNWLAALERVRQLETAELPPLKGSSADPVPASPRNWQGRHPEAYQRFLRSRDAVNATAERLSLPAENLITPDFVRRLAWEPPVDGGTITAEALDSRLAELGARPWQREIVVPVLQTALPEPG